MAQAVIGIVGLDPLTTAFARRLAGQGMRVLVHDSQPERTAALAAYRPGIEIAGSLADIGGECQTVLVWRPTLESLGEALFGTQDRTGLGHELAAGSLIIDLSPGSQPIGDLDGFDSLIAIEATVMIEERVGCRCDKNSLFVTVDGTRALTVREVADRISALIAASGGKP